MTIADELIQRRDFIAFSEDWVRGHPFNPGEECLLYRCLHDLLAEHTLSQGANGWLHEYCRVEHKQEPVFINDHWRKPAIIEMLDTAILRAKQEGL